MLDRLREHASQATSESRLTHTAITTLLRLGRGTAAGDIIVRPRGVPDVAHARETVPGSFSQAISGGSFGLAYGYSIGTWATDDLYNLLQVFAAFQRRWSRFSTKVPALWTQHARTQRRSGITETAEHYDLPLRLFKEFLNPELSYSASTNFAMTDWLSGYRDDYARLVDSMDLQAGDHLVDLGAGWGALTEVVLRESPASVTAFTASASQADYLLAQAWADPERIAVRCSDFSESEFPPAKAFVAFESFEHLSLSGVERTLESCAKAAQPNSHLVIQATVLPDRQVGPRRSASTVANTVIFPGAGALFTRRTLIRAAAMQDFRLVDSRDLTAEFFVIVSNWAARLRGARGYLMTLYGPEFFRLFEFYLTGLAADLAQREVLSSRLTFVGSRDK